MTLRNVWLRKFAKAIAATPDDSNNPVEQALNLLRNTEGFSAEHELAVKRFFEDMLDSEYDIPPRS